MSKHTSHETDATSEHARELTARELDHVAGGTPNVTVNGGPLAFVGPMLSCEYGPVLGHEPLHGRS